MHRRFLETQYLKKKIWQEKKQNWDFPGGKTQEFPMKGAQVQFLVGNVPVPSVQPKKTFKEKKKKKKP